MPLFKRPEAILVRDEHASRLMMPHLSWGRNASAVYHETQAHLGATRTWLRAYNRTQPAYRANVLHLFLWASANVLHERPKLNRFVSGGRLYQRRDVVIALSVKRSDRYDSPITTIKMKVGVDLPFSDFLSQLTRLIDAARADESKVDRELGLGTRLPYWLVRFALAGYRVLDRFNLLPQSLQESDPSFSSLFVANLGSVGLGNTYHHLFELGTNSLFACMGRAQPQPMLQEDGSVLKQPLLIVNWTFDERVADGAYCAGGLRQVIRMLEHPERRLGDAVLAAQRSHPAPVLDE